MNPVLEDEGGRSALFVFCEQLALASADSYPEATAILKAVLDAVPGGGIGGADRTGRTIFDVESLDNPALPYSCLKACRHLLVDAGAHTTTSGNSSNRPPRPSGNSGANRLSRRTRS